MTTRLRFKCRKNLSPRNQAQNLLRKCNNHPARKRHESVRPLGWIVGFERQPNLDNPESEQDHSNCPDDSEDEFTQVVDYRQRVITCGSKHADG